VSVQVPEADAPGLLSRLSGDGLEITEARRQEESLEDAYLRLIKTDNRPS
jgi:hypothetical protein